VKPDPDSVGSRVPDPDPGRPADPPPPPLFWFLCYEEVDVLSGGLESVLWIRDFNPGSRIPDPTTTKRGKNKIVVSHGTFCCGHKFHKNDNYFIF
jgi:hypothetical protein